MQVLQFQVTGMTCDHCVAAITKAIEDLPGVEKASVDLASASALVEGQDLNQAAIIAAVEEEGYEAVAS